MLILGGNYTLSGKDVLQAAVDIGGVFDLSGALDLIGAGMSYEDGDYWGAAASVVGAAPILVGDLAKTGKIAKGIDKISDAIDAAKVAKKEGVVYKRVDKSGNLKDYIGQAKSQKRFDARQKEHRRANPDSDFEFTQIDRAKPGKDLNRKEQKYLDTHGGPTNKSNPNGGTSNKKNVIRK